MKFYCFVVAFVCIAIISRGAEAKKRSQSKSKDQHPGVSFRIVGGTDAAVGQAPFQCSMHYKSRHYCGCAIIAENWILTAAHCFNGKKWQDIGILVGTTKLQPGSGSRLKINQPIIHEQFGYPPFSHDLALIPLQKPIEFDEKVQPIKISTKVVPVGAKLQVFGWGLLWDDGLQPIDLQVLNVKSISDEVCKLQSPTTAHESHLCTLSPDGEGVCTGDSGGPLVLDNELVGIANWIEECGAGLPDGYAKLSFFNDWIERNMKSQ